MPVLDSIGQPTELRRKKPLLLSVILPCQGLEPSALAAVRSMMLQDNVSYRLLLVAADDDPSWPLMRLLQQEASQLIRLVACSNPIRKASTVGLIHAAVEASASDTDVFVLASWRDLVAPDFLDQLVRPMENAELGLALGWRCAMPLPSVRWSGARASWSLSQASRALARGRVPATGGAAAVRASHVPELLRAVAGYAVDCDALLLARAAEERGLRCQTVPAAVALRRELGALEASVRWMQARTEQQYRCDSVTGGEWTRALFWRSCALAAIALFCALAPAAGALGLLPTLAAGILIRRVRAQRALAREQFAPHLLVEFQTGLSASAHFGAAAVAGALEQWVSLVARLSAWRAPLQRAEVLELPWRNPSTDTGSCAQVIALHEQRAPRSNKRTSASA